MNADQPHTAQPALKAFLYGFIFAFRGIGLATRGRNMQVHIAAAIVTIALAAALGITRQELAITICVIGVVMAMETANTAIEKLCDLLAEELKLTYPDERIRQIKDIAAGAVLLVAIAAAIVGAIIFWPYLIDL